MAPRVPWFHNPIHDAESAWWIALWAYRHLDDTIHCLFRDQGERTAIVGFEAMFEERCSALPGSVLTPLDEWLSSIREQYQELEVQIPKGSHDLFDYNDVFDTTIEFVEEILKALSKDPGFAFLREGVAELHRRPTSKTPKSPR